MEFTDELFWIIPIGHFCFSFLFFGFAMLAAESQSQEQDPIGPPWWACLLMLLGANCLFFSMEGGRMQTMLWDAGLNPDHPNYVVTMWLLASPLERFVNVVALGLHGMWFLAVLVQGMCSKQSGRQSF